MPLVIVKTAIGLFSTEETQELGYELQQIVAAALDAPDDPGGKLSPDEIEVEFREEGGRDISSGQLGITIIANKYPSRLANLDERRRQIAEAVRIHPAVPDHIFKNKDYPSYVWVLLADGSFEAL